MALNISNGHITSGENMSVTKLAEQISGFVDVDVLVNIHKYLGESEKNDDIELAAWVKQEYLQEPIVELGRPIRNSEGFANLDKAYRRVRHLTGKAQDKWPFFDQNWKKMSSTVVKKAINGDAAIITPLSDNNAKTRDTPMSSGSGGQQGVPSDNTDGRETNEKDRSPIPNDEEVPRDVNQGDSSGVASFDGTLNGIGAPEDSLRDAGAGKVRGPSGRYVNKSNTPARKVSNSKHSKRSRSSAVGTGGSGEHDTSGDESVKTPQPIPDNGTVSLDYSKEVTEGGSELGTSMPSANSTPNGSDIQVLGSAVLAAEAEAIPSNLDRLPPGFTHKKRKSESSIRQEDLKRSRGSRGGVLGRPRKSETVAEPSQPSLDKDPEHESTAGQSDLPLKRPARRSSRKSAASALELSTPWDPTADVLFSGLGKMQPVNDVNAATNGTSRAASRDHDSRENSVAIDANATVIAPPANLKDNAPTTRTDKRSSQPSNRHVEPTTAKQKKRVSFSPESQAHTVEFFARITTSEGSQEVQLMEDDLTSEVGLVKRYAAWQNAGNANVTFDVFKNIVKFAR